MLGDGAEAEIGGGAVEVEGFFLGGVEVSLASVDCVAVFVGDVVVAVGGVAIGGCDGCLWVGAVCR